MNRAPDGGDEAEAPAPPEQEGRSGPGENGHDPAPDAKSGLAARLSGPAAGIKEAYQRATSKFTPASTAVVVDPEPAPKYLDGDEPPATDGDELEARDELVEEPAEEELEVEVAELAPVVVLPEPEGEFEEAEPGDEVEDDTVTVVVVPDDEVEPSSVVTARRVRKVVRRIDPISVFKLSAVFYVCLFVIFLIAGVLLWSMAVGSGSIDNIESFIVDVGFEDFTFVGGDILRGFVVFGGALIVLGTMANVLLAVLFNLISDLVGGIRYTVIEPTDPESVTESS